MPENSVASSFLFPVNVSRGSHMLSSTPPSPLRTLAYSVKDAGKINLTLPICSLADTFCQPIGTPKVAFDKNPPMIGMSAKFQATFCCTVIGSVVMCEVAKYWCAITCGNEYCPFKIILSPVCAFDCVLRVSLSVICQLLSHIV